MPAAGRAGPAWRMRLSKERAHKLATQVGRVPRASARGAEIGYWPVAHYWQHVKYKKGTAMPLDSAPASAER
jgi:hypothetical protein